MRIEDHKNNIRESIDVIEECIQKGALTQRQRTIGFHCSAAGIDMLEVLLHKKNLIDPGTQIKHDWFVSERKVEEKLSFDFPEKKRIIPLITSIEKNRNLLCYGKPQPERIIENTIIEFKKLKDIFEKHGVI